MKLSEEVIDRLKCLGLRADSIDTGFFAGNFHIIDLDTSEEWGVFSTPVSADYLRKYLNDTVGPDLPLL